jgi:hypothetical protein
MQEHNKKERQILQHVPGYGGINLRSVADFERREQKPVPMQVHINPREAEQVNAAAPAFHGQRL